METANVEHSGWPWQGRTERREVRQEESGRRDFSRNEASLAGVGEAGGRTFDPRRKSPSVLGPKKRGPWGLGQGREGGPI